MLLLPKVIGLVGPAGAGKSTAARLIAAKYGYSVIPFAKPLKDMGRALGLTEDELSDPALKEKPIAHLCNKSPRQILQTLGSEWGRELVGKDLWIRLWHHSTEGRRAVADDVRFLNEAAAIYRRDGIIIRVDRPGAETTQHSQHVSEQEMRNFDADFAIRNTGTLVFLRSEIERVLMEYSNGSASREKEIAAGQTAEAQ